MLAPVRISSLALMLLVACGRTSLPLDAGAAGGSSTSVEDSGVVCGNGVREATEACDGTDLGPNSCTALGFGAGALRCDGQCRYDTSDCAPKAATCRAPAAPFSLSDACLQDMCDCDRDEFSTCDSSCWAKVACRVATCNNAPTHRECADGCPNSTEAELNLGRCFTESKNCLASLPGLDLR